MLSSTTGDVAGEHSEPFTIASEGGATTPNAEQALGAGPPPGGGVGGDGADGLPLPPPHAARSAAQTADTNADLLDTLWLRSLGSAGTG